MGYTVAAQTAKIAETRASFSGATTPRSRFAQTKRRPHKNLQIVFSSPPRLSSTRNRRVRGCVSRREALGRLRRAEAAPHPAARPTRAASLARAFSSSRPRASAVGLGEARATGVSPPAEGRRFDHVRVSWFSPGVTMARASALAALLAATLSAATAQDISAQGGMYYPYGSAVGPFYGCARARATATTPSLVDSETHETRPSAPLRVAAPDPWASSAPSAASASSDTPPP